MVFSKLSFLFCFQGNISSREGLLQGKIWLCVILKLPCFPAVVISNVRLRGVLGNWESNYTIIL